MSVPGEIEAVFEGRSIDSSDRSPTTHSPAPQTIDVLHQGDTLGSTAHKASAGINNRTAFRFPRPKETMEFTGERYISGITGDIQYEHYHRYLYALEFCAGKDVLDVASGEGYGSHILGQVARSVVGIDIDRQAVEFANQHYMTERVSYRQGRAEALPLADASVDVVVSYETVEHFEDQAGFINEIARVLRPGGILLMSSPNRVVYSEANDFDNEFHVHEMDRQEFLDLLALRLANVALFEQRALTGSVILGEGNTVPRQVNGYDTNDGTLFERTLGVPNAQYYLAIASNAPLPDLSNSVMNTPVHIRELERARQEAAVEAHRLAKLWTETRTALDGEVALRDQHIVELQAAAEQSEAALEEARQEVGRVTGLWSATRTTLDGEVALRDERIAELLAAHDTLVRERDVVRAALDAEVRLRDRQIAEFEVARAALGGEIAIRAQRLDEVARELAAVADQRDQALEAHAALVEDHAAQVAALEQENAAQAKVMAQEHAALAQQIKALAAENVATIQARDELVAKCDMLYRRSMIIQAEKRSIETSLTWRVARRVRRIATLLPLVRRVGNLTRGRWSTEYQRIQASGLFDAAYYLRANPDIDANGMDPLIHFVQCGWREGRSPSPHFDLNLYRHQYALTSDVNPLIHHLDALGRDGRPRFSAWVKTALARRVPGLRNLYRLLRPVTHVLDMVPAHDLLPVSGGFRSTGLDPQFILRLPQPMPGGWCELRFVGVQSSAVLRPVLFIFHGPEGQQIRSEALPVISQGDASIVLHLPPDVKVLRLDPLEESDVDFSIGSVHLRWVGRPGAMAYGYRAMGELRRAQVRRRLATLNLSKAKQALLDAAQPDPNTDYRAWVRLYDTLSSEDQAQIRTRIEALKMRPLLSVVMPVYNPRPKYLRRALDTVIEQLYPDWELCIADDKSTNPEIARILKEYQARDPRIKVIFRQQNGHISAASNSALELASGPFVVLMDHDDELPPHALYMVANEINDHPNVDIIYTDEDKVDPDGIRHNPYFKPDWNAALFYSQNFIAHLGVYRTTLLREVGGFRVGFEGSQDYDIALRVLKLTSDDRIRHIPHVLYHWRIFPGVSTFSSDNPDKSIESARRAMLDHFADAPEPVEILPVDIHHWWRVKRPLPKVLPSVSLIIPTRDRLKLVRDCVTGLLDRTRYAGELEIIIVDNESVEPETLAYFNQIRIDRRIKVIRVAGDFNFSSLNNRAVELAAGELIGFINNDIDVIGPEWLEELVTQLVQPGVGAVGAKLLYGHGTLQHAGVVLGVHGVAGHGHRNQDRNSVGYFGRPRLVQEVSAVTAACLLMRRSIFEDIGGYNETDLAVGYNDVDLCIRIRQAGHKIIYTPFAELYHLESASRGADLTPAQRERNERERRYMRDRWGRIVDNDPFYSPNLSLVNEAFQIAFPPRAEKPWRVPPGGAPVVPMPDDTRSWLSQPLRSEVIRGQQARFDRIAEVGTDAVRAMAGDTAIVVVDSAPFMLSGDLIHSIVTGDASVLPRAIMVADVTTGAAQADREAALERWRPLLDAVDVSFVPYGTDDVGVAAAVNLGVAHAKEGNVVIVQNQATVFHDGWFRYLVAAFAELGGHAVVAPVAFSLDGRVLASESLVAVNYRDVLAEVVDYEFLPARRFVQPAELAAGETIRVATELPGTIHMGRKELLLSEGAVFDPLLYLAGHAEALSRRLAAAGVPLALIGASAVSFLADRRQDLINRWEFLHDFVRVNQAWAGAAPAEDTRVEFICPFHRGDVVMGIQAAAEAKRQGIDVRLHVAQGLVGWVRDFHPDFPVEPLPVSVPKAEETYLNLLRSYQHVVTRPDAAPRIVRSHPKRDLSETNLNIMQRMLQELGIGGSLIENLEPRVTPDEEAQARARLRRYGDKVVLLHHSGGWHLKTLPEHIRQGLVTFLHARGYKVVQIGGGDDAALPEVDGWITENLSPAQWAPIFKMAGAVFGVDSWSSHFAGVLDVPQVTFYGSTHPRHVNSKRYFKRQDSPGLILGPVVDCSPCNSLTCKHYDVDWCHGYILDEAALERFLVAL